MKGKATFLILDPFNPSLNFYSNLKIEPIVAKKFLFLLFTLINC